MTCTLLQCSYIQVVRKPFGVHALEGHQASTLVDPSRARGILPARALRVWIRSSEAVHLALRAWPKELGANGPSGSA